MKEFIEYQPVPGGKVRICELEHLTQGEDQELLGVSAVSLGHYEVKSIGALPKAGQILLLPVKGAKQLSLRFEVLTVEPLIQPNNAWRATCLGPNTQTFNVREVQITCDACFKEFRLEFIEASADTSKDALSAMTQQGWMASENAQVCPACQNKSAGH